MSKQDNKQDIFTIDTRAIAIPMWETPDHKIKKAFNDGRRHALNHYHGEPPNPDWPCGVKSWAVSPYTECRPSAFHSWIAGFSEEHARLVRADRPKDV